MKIACIGECMVELTLPREAGGATRVGFAGDTFNAAVYLKRSAPEVTVEICSIIRSGPYLSMSRSRERMPRPASNMAMFAS